MKLQLALDRLTKKECYTILKQTSDAIDWIEIGTGVIKEYGMDIVRDMKKDFPDKVIVADMKTCDAGKHEAKQVFMAGADITTVMGFAHNGTIKDMLEVARENNKRVMVDLLGIDDPKRINEIIGLGADLLSLHIGKDMQKEGKVATQHLFDLIRGRTDVEVTVAGGINEKTINDFLQYNPSVVIVGSAITKAEDPTGVALCLKGMMKA